MRCINSIRGFGSQPTMSIPAVANVSPSGAPETAVFPLFAPLEHWLEPLLSAPTQCNYPPGKSVLWCGRHFIKLAAHSASSWKILLLSQVTHFPNQETLLRWNWLWPFPRSNSRGKTFFLPLRLMILKIGIDLICFLNKYATKVLGWKTWPGGGSS